MNHNVDVLLRDSLLFTVVWQLFGKGLRPEWLCRKGKVNEHLSKIKGWTQKRFSKMAFKVLRKGSDIQEVRVYTQGAFACLRAKTSLTPGVRPI
jgi:hypothetical protein